MTTLEGIQVFKGIIHLNVAKNAILPSTLKFLSPPISSKITHLNLSSNNLDSIPWKELKCIPRLTDLKLDNNNIQKIGASDIARTSAFTLPLKSLSLNHNQLKNISGLQYFSTLDYLDLGNNLLGPSFEECAISCLNDPSLSIQNLSFKGNALCGSRCYIHTIYQYFPALKILDGEMIMLDEKERKRRCAQLKRRCGCPTVVSKIQEHSIPHTLDVNRKTKTPVSPVNTMPTIASSRDIIAFQHIPASPKVEAKILNEMNIEKSKVLTCDNKPEKREWSRGSKFQYVKQQNQLKQEERQRRRLQRSQSRVRFDPLKWLAQTLQNWMGFLVTETNHCLCVYWAEISGVATTITLQN